MTLPETAPAFSTKAWAPSFAKEFIIISFPPTESPSKNRRRHIAPVVTLSASLIITLLFLRKYPVTIPAVKKNNIRNTYILICLSSWFVVIKKCCVLVAFFKSQVIRLRRTSCILYLPSFDLRLTPHAFPLCESVALSIDITTIIYSPLMPFYLYYTFPDLSSSLFRHRRYMLRLRRQKFFFFPNNFLFFHSEPEFLYCILSFPALS